MIILFLLGNQIYAKYNYKIVLDAFSLNRDSSEITYQIEKSVPDGEYTNQGVILNIISNKQIEPIEGFTLDESRTKLTKNVSENEQKNIVLEDLSGNKQELVYYVSNIDKEPPQIIGIENGTTYNKKMSVEYSDNVGIKEINIEKYSNRLVLRCVEDYYDSEYYKGLDSLGNKIFMDIVEYPKEAVYYKFYLNDQWRATTERTDYTFPGVSFATTYTIKVNAYNSNNEIIATASDTVTTKCFEEIRATKTEDTFEVEIGGIHDEVNLGLCTLWYEGMRHSNIY